MRNSKGQFVKGNKRPAEMIEKIRLKKIGQKHTAESRKKISIALTGRTVSSETREKISKKNKGVNLSLKHRKKLSLAKLGKILPPRSESWKKNLSKSLTGKIRTEESKKKQSLSKMGKSPMITKKRLAFYKRNEGENNHLWIDGRTPVVSRVRKCFQSRQWRSDVFQRDEYTCQECGDRSGLGHTVKIEAHHIKRFSVIWEEYKIKTFEDALICEELWNINNGTTLCVKCHNKTRGLNKKK